jgi:hypothetical protein
MAHDHRMNRVGEPHLNKVNRMRMEPTTDPRNTNDDWFNLGEAHHADWLRTADEDWSKYGNLSKAGYEDAEDMSYRGHDPAEILYGTGTATTVVPKGPKANKKK